MSDDNPHWSNDPDSHELYEDAPPEAQRKAHSLHRPCSAFLRVVVETHDSRLEMDTRCGTASYIEARTIEAIRSGCVGILIASPNAPDQGPGRQPQS